MKRSESSTTPQHRTVVVPAADLGLLEAAVALGGGTVIHCRPCADGDVLVTYVGGVLRSSSRPASDAA